MEGKCSLPEVGAVAAGTTRDLPFVLLDAGGCEVRPVSAYLRDLMLGDVSPLTCRSYGFGLLRWHRLLWFLQISWDRATEAEVAALVGWLREACNPQRLRKRNGASPPAGSVNLKTGKPSLREGYAPSTINHNLSVVSGFYAFHARFGAGPAVNPVPASRGHRQALAHRSSLEPVPVLRRGRLRQKVPVQAPRSIPDHLWDELFARRSPYGSGQDGRRRTAHPRRGTDDLAARSPRHHRALPHGPRGGHARQAPSLSFNVGVR
ncbi:hypothetical protein SAMN05444521_1203 [Streptomyces sp. 3214.6]|nr:hypothetical protein SAMN05444521_1203 [Streptomyces sp. 3214.6]